MSSALSCQDDVAGSAREVAAGLAGLGPGPAAAAVFFASPGFGPTYAPIERAIRDAIGGGEVVGCSAAGLLSLAGERRRGSAVSALAWRGDFAVRRIYLPALRGRADLIGREIGRTVATIEREPRSVLLLADSYNLAPDELLAGIEAAAPGTVVVGAGASENGSDGVTTVVGRGAASGNAVAGLVFGGLDVRCMVAQGATPVGSWSVITRAESNRILELDGRPALPVFVAQLPAVLREDLHEALRRTRAALAEPGSAATDPSYVIRRLLGADVSSDALVVGDEVLPGMRFAVAVRDPRSARESVTRGLERFVAERPAIAGALYFNSVERGEALYGIADLDTAYLRSSLGEVPLAGFFSAAELAPLDGRNRFHQESGVLIGFAES